jgi:hypothetical protein
VEEITLTVERDEESGLLVASWNAPRGGGITTQGKDLTELEADVHEAVLCHFGRKQTPSKIRLHCLNDPVLAGA